QSTGDEADLWWAVRGCAPNLGVVTSATLRLHSSPTRVFAQRLLLPLDVLPVYLELAQALPRDIAASAVLGRPPGGGDPDDPVLFLYVAHGGDSTEGMGRVQEMTRALTRGAAPLLERGEIQSYSDLPPMDPPAVISGFDTPQQQLPATSRRLF